MSALNKGRKVKGYIYSVWLERKGRLIILDDSLLPGILLPDKSLQNMRCEIADRLGLCKDCPVASRSHVIVWVNENLGEKYCPVLFHDAVKPKWRIEELV